MSERKSDGKTIAATYRGLQVSVELYCERQHFLGQNDLIPEQKQLIHAVSYACRMAEQPHELQETVIELYLDHLCIAAAYYFPQKLEEAVIALLTEELLKAVCLSELKFPFYKEKWVSELLSASIIDEFVDNIVEESYAKTIRNQSAYRLFNYFAKR